jgi:hypothetical protein
VQFLPRTAGVVKKSELLTSTAKWFHQQCDAEDEEADAFHDMVVYGMGRMEARLDYEDNPEDPKRLFDAQRSQRHHCVVGALGSGGVRY